MVSEQRSVVAIMNWDATGGGGGYLYTGALGVPQTQALNRYTEVNEQLCSPDNTQEGKSNCMPLLLQFCFSSVCVCATELDVLLAEQVVRHIISFVLVVPHSPTVTNFLARMHAIIVGLDIARPPVNAFPCLFA